MASGEIHLKEITAEKITFTAKSFEGEIVADDLSIDQIFDLNDFRVFSVWHPIDVPEVLCADMQKIVKGHITLLDEKKKLWEEKSVTCDGDRFKTIPILIHELEYKIKVYNMAAATCMKAAFGVWPHELKL